MNEELENKLNESLIDIIDWLKKNGAAVENFIKEQTPLLVEEILDWNFFYHLVWMCIGLFIILISVVILMFMKKYWEEISKDDCEGIVIFPMFFTILGLLVVFSNLFYIIKIRIAPRLFILEELKSLI